MAIHFHLSLVQNDRGNVDTTTPSCRFASVASSLSLQSCPAPLPPTVQLPPPGLADIQSERQLKVRREERESEKERRMSQARVFMEKILNDKRKKKEEEEEKVKEKEVTAIEEGEVRLRG